MKKIPTLFERTFENHRVTGITPRVTPGLEWVLDGKGYATIKHDGSCCAIIDGKFYKRFDAKKGKTPPEGAIPCCEPDPVTGHHPHWVEVNKEDPADKWFVKALVHHSRSYTPTDGTYEAIGPHFQGNPYELEEDTLVRHGNIIIGPPRTFDGMKHYLIEHEIEGIVFWRDGEPMCKIKRSDFGLPWPVKK
jgi:hypothetical protein